MEPKRLIILFYCNSLLTISPFHNPVGLLPAERGGEAILGNGTI